MSVISENRRFMHCPSFKEGMSASDQSKEVPPPPFHRVISPESIPLTPFEGPLPCPGYEALLDVRRSVRSYADKPLTQGELSFLLWSAQGIQFTRGHSSLRPVPSGGARHPFETYIAVRAVEGLAPGMYHYTPQSDIGEKKATIGRICEFDFEDKIAPMLAGQKWAVGAPAILFFTCVPYRAEWRYVDMAHRVMLIDLGHLGQNVMLSAAALGLGSCCMAAYDQALCDEALRLDDLEEYTVYAISVGTAHA
ncbi:MAG: SagB/ThcOx family dehydrogenase [Defluviitaleaceae bacterium]|nr:SagB/ThcOx family dehydrogenase [Defluviitaleaceae bacterium]MCL2239241.1 SagB/ThcOx family dehydrogenase [Defluviitaleaceae bacterium]MCL2239805.1 SagB/ThcOx family dehydrogenase [Defluviitaleaceae bacterium]